MSSLFQADFDRTKHLSDKHIKKRRLEREHLMKLEKMREERVRKEREAEERKKEEERCSRTSFVRSPRFSFYVDRMGISTKN